MDGMKEKSSSSRWLTEFEAAKICGLSVHTLRAQRQKSVGIPYAKIGRAVRYNLGEVVNFMQQHTVNYTSCGGRND